MSDEFYEWKLRLEDLLKDSLPLGAADHDRAQPSAAARPGPAQPARVGSVLATASPRGNPARGARSGRRTSRGPDSASSLSGGAWRRQARPSPLGPGEGARLSCFLLLGEL
ncbi:uncharacterized protein RHO17_012725 [Thomomys bottae]